MRHRKKGKGIIMDFVKRSEVPEKQMLGRVTSAAYGKEGIAAVTAEQFVGWATFSPKYGQMKPHCHEDETMYIVKAEHAFVRYGATKDTLCEPVALCTGDIIRARDGEWHEFCFDSEDGELDIVAIFGVPLCHTVEL